MRNTNLPTLIKDLSVDTAKCAGICDMAPTCNSFLYTYDGKCEISGGTGTAS